MRGGGGLEVGDWVLESEVGGVDVGEVRVPGGADGEWRGLCPRLQLLRVTSTALSGPCAPEAGSAAWGGPR